MDANRQILEKALGKDKASKVIKLVEKYDKYILKFKNSINKLLLPIGIEVVIGLAFVQKENVQEINNGSTN